MGYKYYRSQYLYVVSYGDKFSICDKELEMWIEERWKEQQNQIGDMRKKYISNN